MSDVIEYLTRKTQFVKLCYPFNYGLCIVNFILCKQPTKGLWQKPIEKIIAVFMSEYRSFAWQTVRCNCLVKFYDDNFSLKFFLAVSNTKIIIAKGCKNTTSMQGSQ